MLISLGFWEWGCPLHCGIAPSIFYAKRPGEEVGAQRTSTGSEAFSLLMYKMCIAKCLYSYKDDSPENLGTTTVQEYKKYTSS